MMSDRVSQIRTAEAESHIEQMKAAEGVTEGMKQHDQMAWVGAMNSVRNRAEEIIIREMIYGENAV